MRSSDSVLGGTMKRSTVVTASLSLAAGMLVGIPATATAQDRVSPRNAAMCAPTSPTPTPWGTVSGTITGGEVTGGTVYAVNMETGSRTCVTINANGSYGPLELPETGSRRPADFWVVVANPPLGSSLGSRSLVVPSAAVTENAALSGRDMALSSKNLNVTASVGGDDTVALACLYSEVGGDLPISCGMTQPYSDPSSFHAQLTVPSGGGKKFLDAQATSGSVRYSGVYDGHPTPVTAAATVEMAEDVLQECGQDDWSFSGAIVRDVDGTSAPSQARIGGAIRIVNSQPPIDVFRPIQVTNYSYPSGQFRTCIPFYRVPPGVQKGSGLLVTTAISGGGVVFTTLAGKDDTQLNNLSVNLSATPQIKGTVTKGGIAQAGTEWNIATVRNGMPREMLLADNARTDHSGAWSIAGLPDDTYSFFAFPADDDTSAPVLSKGFVIAGGQLVGFAGAPASGSDVGAQALATGTFQGRAIKPDGSPMPLAPVRAGACTDPNNLSTCTMSGTRTNSQGYFALSLPTSGFVEITVETGWESDVAETTVQGAISSGVASGWTGAPVITMQRPNGAFRLMGSNGLPLAATWVNLNRLVGGDSMWEDYRWGETDDSGIFYADFDDSGIFWINAQPDNGPSAEYFFKAELSVDDTVAIFTCNRVTDENTSCPGTPVSKVAGAWTVQQPVANLSGTLRSRATGGDVVAEGQIRVETINGDNQTYYGNYNTKQSGEFYLGLPNGNYRVTFQKPYQSTQPWADNSYYVTVTNSGACLKPNSVASCTPSGPLVGLNLHLLAANVTGTVYQANGQEVMWGWIEVRRACDEYDGCTEFVTGTNVSQGQFSLSLAEDDTYYMSISPQSATDGSARTTFTLYVAPGQTYNNQTFTLKGANVTGTVTLPGGAPAQYAWVQVEKRTLIDDFEQWQWVDVNAESNASGNFALFLGAGNYRLRVQPGSGTPGASPALSATFTIAGADDTEIVNVSLSTPNVSGSVALPGGAPAAYAWLEIRHWNSDSAQYEWTNQVSGTSTNGSGVFAMSLPAGRWQLVANPPWGNTTASKVTRNIVVSSGTYCIDNGSGACTSDDTGSPIVLGAPNVSGVLKYPNGSPAGNTWIDVLPWENSVGDYRWSPEYTGINVNSNGSFATKLSAGDYQLVANPPWGTSGSTKSAVNVTVEANGLLCLTATKPCGADDSIPSLTITLGSPNILGSVLAGGSAVGYSNINVEKWNSDRGNWDWVNMWANSTGSGSFALTLEDGRYKVTAQPTSATSEYSAGKSYVYVTGAGQCSPTSEDSAISNSPCSVVNSPLNLVVNLAAADLQGTVTDGTHPQRDAWVSVMKVSGNGWYDWVGGTSTRSNGSFALKLDPGTTSTRYRVEVFPPWNGSGELTRTAVDLVSYASGGNTRVCRLADWSGSTCASPIGSLTVTLSSGNIRGFVKVPGTDDTGVRDSWISVEKWVEAPWNPGSGQFVWQWADVSTDSKAGGRFSLNLDSAGVYRIEARPPWNNPSGWASKRTVIQVSDVAGSQRWCLQDDTTGTIAGAHGACESPYSTDDSRLSIRLATPNVTTRVFNAPGGAAVADAWVGVQKLETFQIPGTNDTYQTYQWLGGSSTNATGYFYANLDDSGSYRINVNAPWNSGSALPSFTKDFTINASGAESGLDDTVAFPTPNVNGFVLSSTNSNTKVPNSWISVEHETSPGQFEWMDAGTSSNGAGRYVLSLAADDTYRVTANPAWDNPSGVARSVTIRVNGAGVASCLSGCTGPFDIQLKSANVTGSVVYGSPSTAMPYGWIEVRDGNGDFAGGTGSNAEGGFAMNLADGTYTMTAYPNWSVAARPPVSTTIVVSGGSLTQVGGASASTVLLDFDAVTPNVVVTVTGVTGNRFIMVERSNGGAWVTEPDLTAVTSGGVARFSLQAGSTYRFTVIPDVGKTASNNVSGPVTVPGSGAANVAIAMTETS
jgi:hypothetical protein